MARRVDPEYRVTWYAIHSWKRYFQHFPNRLTEWATTPIDTAASKRKHIGPITQLAQQLQQVGWQLTLTNAEIRITTHWGTLDAMTSPTALLRQLFDDAWNGYLAHTITRKNFQPIT